jgi:hypothetical protein
LFSPQTKYAILDIPKNTSATGSCGNDSQVMNLTWYNEDKTGIVLNIVFTKNITDSHFMIQNISLVVTPNDEMFPGIKGNLQISFTEVLLSIMFSVNRL